LGSFAQSSFDSADQVVSTIEREPAAAAGAPVRVPLADATTLARERVAERDGESLDTLPVDCSVYEVDPATLGASGETVEEALTTNLFRSVCPVTAQPDIASMRIAYRGARIDRAGLLRYLVSYRRHPGFHEHCVERIFVDLLSRCGCDLLTVYARFTRRGGIDIHPFRTTPATDAPRNVPNPRQ